MKSNYPNKYNFSEAKAETTADEHGERRPKVSGAAEIRLTHAQETPLSSVGEACVVWFSQVARAFIPV